MDNELFEELLESVKEAGQIMRWEQLIKRNLVTSKNNHCLSVVHC